MEPLTLKTLSLNCWAVPISSKDVLTRLPAIGRFLQASDCDIVFLQELWTRKAFDLIEAECKNRFPYTRCFFSGRVGTSGLCVFSRFPISDTFFHSYMLNGYWYAFHHGDSHGCKGVGFLRIMVGSFALNCFVTHLHAEYDRKNDKYYAHRTAQAYELLKFADMAAPAGSNNMTGSITLVAGDLNLEPQDLGVQVLEAGGFRDTWKELHGDELVGTCDRPDNRYTASANNVDWPNGKKIDYILYRTGKGKCEVIDSSVVHVQVPDTSLPLSDHEAVTATFKLSVLEKHSAPKTPSPTRDKKVRDNGAGDTDALFRAREVLKQAVKDSAVSCVRWIYGILAFLVFGFLCILLAPSLVNLFTTPIYVLLLVASVMHYFLLMRQEHVHLTEMMHLIDNDLNLRKESDEY